MATAERTKLELLYFTTEGNAVPHEIREDSDKAMQLSHPSDAKPQSDYTETNGNIEDDPKSDSQSIEVNSNIVTKLLDVTGNSDSNDACEISIEPDAGMLTQKPVLEDQQDGFNHSATHLDTTAKKDKIDVPITTNAIGGCLSYNRCSGDILQLEIDRTNTVAETVFSTEYQSGGDTHLPLQPQLNCKDQEIVFSSAVATATSGEEPCVKRTYDSLSQTPHFQLSFNGVAADTAVLCEDKGDECVNDVLQPKSVKQSCHMTRGSFTNCFDCIPQHGEHFLIKEEAGPDSQTSNFYLTPVTVEDPPMFNSSPKEVAHETETRTPSKTEDFEMARQSQGDIEMYCLESDDKLEEGTANEANHFEVELQSVVDRNNSTVNPESRKDEILVSRSEVFETNVSQEDQEMSCVGYSDKTQKKPDDKADIYEVDQQSMADVEITPLESGSKIEERSVKKFVFEVFDVDWQSCVDLKMSCIKPESKTGERPVKPVDVFEVDQQLAVCLEIPSIEATSKTKEKLGNNVFQVEISCFGSESTMEGRAVNGVQICPFDKKPLASVAHGIGATLDTVTSQQQKCIIENMSTDTDGDVQDCAVNKEYLCNYADKTVSSSSEPDVLDMDQTINTAQEVYCGREVMAHVWSGDQTCSPIKTRSADVVIGDMGMHTPEDDELMREPHHGAQTSEVVPSPVATTHPSNQCGTMHGAENTTVLQDIVRNKDEALTSLMEYEVGKSAQIDKETVKQQDKTAMVMELSTALDPQLYKILGKTKGKEFSVDKNAANQENDIVLSPVMSSDGDLAVNETIGIAAKQEGQPLSAQHTHESGTVAALQMESSEKISSVTLIYVRNDGENTVAMDICGHITFAGEQQTNAGRCRDMDSASDDDTVSDGKLFEKQNDVIQEPNENMESESAGNVLIHISDSGHPSELHTVLKTDACEEVFIHDTIQDIGTANLGTTADNTPKYLGKKLEMDLKLETDLINNNPPDGSTEPPMPPQLEPSDNMNKRNSHGDLHKTSAHDNMHERSSHDDMHERSVHDDMHERSVHDDMHERSVHDDMHERSVHDDIHERSVHADMHEGSVHGDMHDRSVHGDMHKRSAHNDMRERSVHDDMHRRSVHDDMHDRSVHGDMHDRSVHGDMRKRSAHNDIHERSAHDDMHERSVPYDMRERSVHDNMYERSINDEIHEKSINDDMYERSIHDDMHETNFNDNMHERSIPDDMLERSVHDDMHGTSFHEDRYTRIKSCIHSITCNSKLVVQFASPLASYIEYSNGESSCSSEDTQDAMETMLYLNNDAMYSEHDLTFSTVPKPWGFEDHQIRYAECSVTDSVDIVQRSDLESDVNSKKDMSDYTRSSSDAIETNRDDRESPSRIHDRIVETERTLVNTECKEATCETHKCFSCETHHIHRKNDTFDVVPDKQQEDTTSGCSMNLNSFSHMDVQAESTVDQDTDSVNVTEVQEQHKIIEHSLIIRGNMKSCIDELLEAVYSRVDQYKMSTSRKEEGFEEETDTTNTTLFYGIYDDDASKGKIQQTGNKNLPTENVAEGETPTTDTIKVTQCDYGDTMKQMTEERECEVLSPGRCFKPDIADDKHFSAVSLSHEYDKRKDSDSQESDIPNKLKILAVGCGEDVNCYHAEPSTKLQDNDVGQYRSWTKKETIAVVEDQEVPSADTSHISPKLEESMYAETSSPCGTEKQGNSESSFRWRYAPSIGSPDILPGSAVIADYDPGDSRLPMLKTCNKPRRVGLSRRAHVSPLHPYFRGNSKTHFS